MTKYVNMANSTLRDHMLEKYTDKWGWWKGPAVTREVFYRLDSFVAVRELVEDLVSLAEDAMHEANRYGGGMYDVEAELGEAREYLRTSKRTTRKTELGSSTRKDPYDIRKVYVLTEAGHHFRRYPRSVLVKIWDKDDVYYVGTGGCERIYCAPRRNFDHYYQEEEKGT